jgi:hypothetical protein
MPTEQNKRLTRPIFEGVGTLGNLAVGDELCVGSQQKALERKIFGLALALATEPSKLGQLRQMLLHLQEQEGVPEDFYIKRFGNYERDLSAIPAPATGDLTFEIEPPPEAGTIEADHNILPESKDA